MCDPFTMIALAVGGIGSMMMASQSLPTPPKAEQPAIAAPTARNPGATVRLGSSSDDITNDLDPEDPSRRVAAATRSTGNTLGNLGRSSLTI
jgi:hypothetical protein